MIVDGRPLTAISNFSGRQSAVYVRQAEQLTADKKRLHLKNGAVFYAVKA